MTGQVLWGGLAETKKSVQRNVLSWRYDLATKSQMSDELFYYFFTEISSSPETLLTFSK